MKRILRAVRSLLKASLVLFEVVALHLLAFGLLTGRERVSALFGGALILCFLFFGRTTGATVYNTIKFYVATLLVADACLFLGGQGCAGVWLIVAALADDRQGIRDAADAAWFFLWLPLLIAVVLGYIANLFGFWETGVPSRPERRYKTAAEVQGTIFDRLAEQWRKGR